MFHRIWYQTIQHILIFWVHSLSIFRSWLCEHRSVLTLHEHWPVALPPDHPKTLSNAHPPRHPFPTTNSFHIFSLGIGEEWWLGNVPFVGGEKKDVGARWVHLVGFSGMDRLLLDSLDLKSVQFLIEHLFKGGSLKWVKYVLFLTWLRHRKLRNEYKLIWKRWPVILADRYISSFFIPDAKFTNVTLQQSVPFVTVRFD